MVTDIVSESQNLDRFYFRWYKINHYQDRNKSTKSYLGSVMLNRINYYILHQRDII